MTDFPLPEPYADGTPQDHADALRDHTDLRLNGPSLDYFAAAGAALIEQQAAEIERLRAVATKLRSAMIDQHELAGHWLDSTCESCANAADHGEPAYACDRYTAWQKAYMDATALNIEPVTP
jgi:hypothetical protein